MSQDPDALDIVNTVKSKRKTAPKVEEVKPPEPVRVHTPPEVKPEDLEPASETEKTPPPVEKPKKKRVATETQKENLKKGRELRAKKLQEQKPKAEVYAEQPPINRKQLEQALWTDLEELNAPKVAQQPTRPATPVPAPTPMISAPPVYDEEINRLKEEIGTLRKTLHETVDKIPKKKDPLENPYFRMFHGRKN